MKNDRLSLILVFLLALTTRVPAQRSAVARCTHVWLFWKSGEESLWPFVRRRSGSRQSRCWDPDLHGAGL